MKPLPLELQQAIEEGALTDEQLRELITLEADALGLTFKEAVECARNRTLPHNVLGFDLEFLIVYLLPSPCRSSRLQCGMQRGDSANT